MTSPSLPRDHAQNIPLGIGLMVLGMFIFSVNDALGKWLAATYSVGQILLFRSIAAWLVLAPFLGREGLKQVVTVQRPGMQTLRVILGTAEGACFYAAVSVLPLADAVTYYLAGPIYVTLLAAVILKEKVGWRRWTAVLVGFVGVIVALQPSADSFGWPALIAFAGSVLYALFLVVTRTLRGTPDTVMAAWQMSSALLFGIVAAPLGWVPLAGPVDVLLLGLLGIVALVAIICVNRSLKLAPASAVVPFQYTLIVWAAIFGYFVFGDLPDLATIIGAAIIIGAGLFIFFREQKVAGKMSKDVIPGP